MKINGLILAAGMSSRMGDFKPLMKINNKSIIEQTIDSMLNSGVNYVTVVLGYRGEEIESMLRNNGYLDSCVKVVYNKYYENTEMLDSVKIGIKNIDECDAFYLLPGDMPAIKKNTFIKVREAMMESKGKVVFPTIEGYKKHPPLISKEFINNILEFNSEGGLRELWKEFNEDIIYIKVDDIGCTLDADTKSQFIELCEYMSK